MYFSNNELKLIAELQPSLENTGFVFEAFDTDSIHISGIPVNTTESEISMVLEQLLSDLQDGIPAVSYTHLDVYKRQIYFSS